MSTGSLAPRATSPPTLRSFLRMLARWLAGNLGQTVFSACVGGLIGWATSLVLMVGKYEGFNDLPRTAQGSPVGLANLVTVPGNMSQGGLIWGLASTVLFGVLGYWRAVGTQRFFKDLASLPAIWKGLFEDAGTAAQVHLLWGTALSLLASQIISPWLGMALAAGLFASAPSLLGQVVSGMLFRCWSALVGLVAPTRKLPLHGAAAMTVGLLGAAAAMLIAFFVSTPSYRLTLAVLCVVGAVLLMLTGRSGPTARLLLLAAFGAWLYDLLTPLVALADDGGWQEAGGNLRSWIRSEGAGTAIKYAATAGLGSAAGGSLGWGLGNVLGRAGPEGGSGPIIDPWTGKPLVPWEPGRFGPGANGQEGKPGQVRFGGNWVDPADAREAIQESLAAEQRRQRESEQFHEQGRRQSEQWLRQRATQTESEPGDDQGRRQQAGRYVDMANRLRDQLPPDQWNIIDRILGGIDSANPTPDDIARLQRLVHALANQAQGRSELEGADAQRAAAAAQLGVDVARTIKEVGQAAGQAVEGTLLPGTRGAITNFIYGAAEGAAEGPGAMLRNGLSGAATGVAMAAGFAAANHFGVPLPQSGAGQTALGFAIGAGTAAYQGQSPGDIIKEGLWGGLGAAVGHGLEGGLRPPTEDGSTPHAPDEPPTQGGAEPSSRPPDPTDGSVPPGTRERPPIGEPSAEPVASGGGARKPTDGGEPPPTGDEGGGGKSSRSEPSGEPSSSAGGGRMPPDAEPRPPEGEGGGTRAPANEPSAEPAASGGGARKPPEGGEPPPAGDDGPRGRSPPSEPGREPAASEGGGTKPPDSGEKPPAGDEGGGGKPPTSEPSGEPATSEGGGGKKPSDSGPDGEPPAGATTGDKGDDSLQILQSQRTSQPPPPQVDPAKAQQMADATTQSAADPVQHVAELPGLLGDHSTYPLSGSSNAEIPSKPFTCDSGVTITDPVQASLARHVQGKLGPGEDPWMSFTSTYNRAHDFNSGVVAQVDIPESQLNKMLQAREAGRVDYGQMQDSQHLLEQEFCLRKVSAENWKMITEPPTGGPRMREEGSGPMAGFQYYRNANGDKVYRLYRGLNARDLPPGS